MKLLLFITISTLGFQSYANDYFQVAPIRFEVTANNPLEKLETTLKYPEGLLNKFKPAGAVITNKKVSQNNVSFNMTKSYLLISKTLSVKGTLDANQTNDGCLKGESGFNIVFKYILNLNFPKNVNNDGNEFFFLIKR